MVSRFLQILGAFVVCGLALWWMSWEDYAKLGGIIALIVMIVLANRDSNARELRSRLEQPAKPIRAVAYDISLVLLVGIISGIFWPSLPLIAVYSWRGTAASDIPDGQQDSSTSRRRDEEA